MTLSNRAAMEQYAEQTAALIDLPIPSDCKPGVVDNLMRTAAIAQLVLEFPLSPDLEAAPVFSPKRPEPPIS